jgi:hypothetical protein
MRVRHALSCAEFFDGNNVILPPCLVQSYLSKKESLDIDPTTYYAYLFYKESQIVVSCSDLTVQL